MWSCFFLYIHHWFTRVNQHSFTTLRTAIRAPGSVSPRHTPNTKHVAVLSHVAYSANEIQVRLTSLCICFLTSNSVTAVRRAARCVYTNCGPNTPGVCVFPRHILTPPSLITSLPPLDVICRSTFKCGS